MLTKIYILTFSVVDRLVSPIASKMVSSEDRFQNLSDDILEYILARLSLFSLVAAKNVCKRWASVTGTPEFDILRKEINPKPCLLQCGICLLDPNESECFAYDVDTDVWVKLPGLQLPAQQCVSPYGPLAGASGVVFAVSGRRDDRVLYKLTSSWSSAESFGETWYETPAMMFPRSYPVVSVAVGAGMRHKVVVAGGGSGFSPGHRAVEVFDSESGTWESYGDLPEEFLGFNSRTWMSGGVCDNKFYVSELYIAQTDRLRIHFLDLYTKQWASVQLERPEGLIVLHIMAMGTTLVVVGLCADSSTENPALKLWKVDLKTLSLIQIGVMPSELTALVKEPAVSGPWIVFGNENLVYVCMRDWEVVQAEVSLEEHKTYWRLLPAHPYAQGPILFDWFVTFCASISSA